jgi:hypothetical protein
VRQVSQAPASSSSSGRRSSRRPSRNVLPKISNTCTAKDKINRAFEEAKRTYKAEIAQRKDYISQLYNEQVETGINLFIGSPFDDENYQYFSAGVTGTNK